MKINIIQGDITALVVDAVVNAANKTLYGGGGVDGAIHSRAGPELRRFCEELRKTKLPNGLLVGEAVVTPGFKLPAKWIIHTVGPIYDPEKDQSQLLSNCFEKSLILAEKKGLKTIAFPAISTGIYGYPKIECAKVARSVIKSSELQSIKEITLCLYSKEDQEIFQKAFR